MLALTTAGSWVACGGGDHRAGPAASDPRGERAGGGAVPSTTAPTVGPPSATASPTAVEPGLDAGGTTLMRLKVMHAPAPDRVEQATAVLRSRLAVYGAPVGAAARAGDAITFSWDRGNVPDEVVALALAQGHLQLRVVTERRPGACPADSLPSEAGASSPIRLSSLRVPTACFSMTGAEVSDPAASGSARRRRGWDVPIRFHAEGAAAVQRMCESHLEADIALVVDAVLLGVFRGRSLVGSEEIATTEALDERAARHYAAVIDSGAHDLELRLERFTRSGA